MAYTHAPSASRFKSVAWTTATHEPVSRRCSVTVPLLCRRQIHAMESFTTAVAAAGPSARVSASAAGKLTRDVFRELKAVSMQIKSHASCLH